MKFLVEPEPEDFLIRNEISCGTRARGLSHLTGLVFLEQTGDAVREHAGEPFLDRDCFSLAALKLACLRSSLLKLLALCKAGLIILEFRRGDSGGKGDLGGVSVGFVSFCADSSSGFSMI